MSQSRRFHPQHEDPFPRPPGAVPAVTVSERLALSLRALGAAGEVWLAGLPGLLAGLEADWSVTVGTRLDGGNASYVAEAVTHDGTPVVLKAPVPPGIDGFTPFKRQLAALQLAGGDPYAGLIRYDVPLAVRCAAAREASFDPGRAVLVHGDVHALNALQVPGPAGAGTGFRLVDPEGLISEPAHDLGVIQVRGVQGWIGDLAVDDPQQALETVAWRCRHAGRLTGADPEAIWQWAFAELVSTGLFMLRLGHHEAAETFLAVAGKLATATATGQPRQAGPVTPERVTGERPARQPHRPPPAPVEGQPGPAVMQDPPAATLLLVVGLPGAGKTTQAKELAAAYRALRLTPDEWMIPLFGEPMADGKRFVLEGRLISVALQALGMGTSVVLDFGLWGRDERSALRWLARSAGASCQVVYLPIDKDAQLARIAHRQATAPHHTFPMSEADVNQWREQFQVPDAAELGGGKVPGPPAGWPGWPEWAAEHWPSLADSYASEAAKRIPASGQGNWLGRALSAPVKMPSGPLDRHSDDICAAGCLLPSAPCSGCPLLWAEWLAAWAGTGIASVAWLRLILGRCGVCRPARHGSRTGPGDKPGHRRWCCCTRSASSPQTGRRSRRRSRPLGACTRLTCAGTAPVTGTARTRSSSSPRTWRHSSTRWDLSRRRWAATRSARRPPTCTPHGTPAG
jgi:predicted kinase